MKTMLVEYYACGVLFYALEYCLVYMLLVIGCFLLPLEF